MTTPFREIVRLPEFERDIKRLLRRFRSLEDDLVESLSLKPSLNFSIS